jgi:hypothetical protein
MCHQMLGKAESREQEFKNPFESLSGVDIESLFGSYADLDFENSFGSPGKIMLICPRTRITGTAASTSASSHQIPSYFSLL